MKLIIKDHFINGKAALQPLLRKGRAIATVLSTVAAGALITFQITSFVISPPLPRLSSLSPKIPASVFKAVGISAVGIDSEECKAGRCKDHILPVRTDEILAYAQIDKLKVKYQVTGYGYDKVLPTKDSEIQLNTELLFKGYNPRDKSYITYDFSLQNTFSFYQESQEMRNIDNIWMTTYIYDTIKNIVVDRSPELQKGQIHGNGDIEDAGYANLYVYAGREVKYGFPVVLNLATVVENWHCFTRVLFESSIGNQRPVVYDTATIKIRALSKPLMLVSPTSNISMPVRADLLFGGGGGGTNAIFEEMDAKLGIYYTINGALKEFTVVDTNTDSTDEGTDNLRVKFPKKDYAHVVIGSLNPERVNNFNPPIPLEFELRRD